MENKKVFFNGCDRILANKNFDWSKFYDPKEVDKLNSDRNLCGTTGCLMHEYPRIDNNFSYGLSEDGIATGIEYFNLDTDEIYESEEAFANYHEINLDEAKLIILVDYGAWLQLEDHFAGKEYLETAISILELPMNEITSEQAVFFFLFVLINTNWLSVDEIPEHLLEIYHLVPNGK